MTPWLSIRARQPQRLLMRSHGLGTPWAPRASMSIGGRSPTVTRCVPTSKPETGCGRMLVNIKQRV